MSTRSKPTPTPAPDAADNRPKLLFFCTNSSGRSRRIEGYLAGVLQRRRNHDTFQLHRIDYHTRADLVHRCGIQQPPALVVIENGHVLARIQQPRGSKEIQDALAPWLR
jgi:thioredoxin-like negative regulator of GroEL